MILGFKRQKDKCGQIKGEDLPVRNGFTSKLRSFFSKSEVSPLFFDELEEVLISSDIDLKTAVQMVDAVRNLKKIDDIKLSLRNIMKGLLKYHNIEIREKPHVIMVIGVNGTGKTTTIAKLAHNYRNEGKKVLLVAADTFRAAAIDQLKVWGESLEVQVVAQQPDSDPAAVAYDGVESALAKACDVVILDTAGRIHTKKNLMDELLKVKRVVGKALPGSPHDILLVLDATVGQNGLLQAQAFHDVLGLTGVIMSKMDGTAKGGVIFSITKELGLPVSFIGVGEKLEDLEVFDPDRFVNDII